MSTQFTPFELLELNAMQWRQLSDHAVMRSKGLALVSDPETHRIKRVTLTERRAKRRERRRHGTR